MLKFSLLKAVVVSWFCQHLSYFTEVKMPSMVSLRKKKATIKKLKCFNSEDFYSTLWGKDSDLFGWLSKICVLKNIYRSCIYIKMQIWALSICCYSWNNLIFRILLLWIIFLHLEALVSVFFPPISIGDRSFLKRLLHHCLLSFSFQAANTCSAVLVGVNLDFMSTHLLLYPQRVLEWSVRICSGSGRPRGIAMRFCPSQWAYSLPILIHISAMSQEQT